MHRDSTERFRAATRPAQLPLQSLRPGCGRHFAVLGLSLFSFVALTAGGPVETALAAAAETAHPLQESDPDAGAGRGTEKPSVPVFQDGEAQVVPGFKNPGDWIRHDLFVETEFDSDGNGKPDRVHVAVTRQKQTETEGLKVPVIYITSPYFAGVGSTSPQFMWDPKHELGATPPDHLDPEPIPQQSLRPVISSQGVGEWVPRGFAVVHSESPGTGLSQGCPTVGGKNESLAPKAVIDWLNGRARGFTEIDGDVLVTAGWCTGKVGMTGTSYEGTLPLAAATTGVEGLEAIIPVAPNTSYYHYYRSNGLVRHPGGYMGEDIDVLYNFIDSGDAGVSNWCDSEIRDGELAKGMDRLSGDYNSFWEGRDYLKQLGPMKAATLMAHGFNDWNVMPEHSFRIYEALRAKGVPAQIFYHQGGHGGNPPRKMMNRWFTRWLYGIENGVEKDPRSWIVREDARRNQPTAYPDYPHPEASGVEFFPRPGGNSVGDLTTEKPPVAVTEKLVDDYRKSGADLAKAETSDHRLLYATAELKAPLHLSGTGKVRIKLASDRPAANLSVWLVALPWTDSDRIFDDVITRGWADPQNHASLSESQPLVPGRFYELAFSLQPDDQVLPAGTRIGLMVFSSDRDFTLWPAPGTGLSVDLGGTSLELPVVGGRAALDAAVQGSPEAATASGR